MRDLMEITSEEKAAAAAAAGWERTGVRQVGGDNYAVYANGKGEQFATPEGSMLPEPLRQAMTASSIAFFAHACPVCAAPAAWISEHDAPVGFAGRVQLIHEQTRTPAEITVRADGGESETTRGVFVDPTGRALAIVHEPECPARPAAIVAMVEVSFN